MNNIAIIPARGGSKRIPRKNIRPFLGKPMISYAIEAARKSGVFKHIVVSTDDREIADTAKSFGAEIFRMRPRELADDFTGTFQVTQSEVAYLDSIGIRSDYVCTIYATVPLIRAEDIKNCLDQMTAGGMEHAYTMCSYPFPIWRSCYIRDQHPTPIWPENMPKRSQDLPEAYHDAGQFYWDSYNSIITGKPESNGPETLAYLLPRSHVVDIDTVEDWETAELMYRVINHV
jgi:N-acylneuraminate cytidylyltransferase